MLRELNKLLATLPDDTQRRMVEFLRSWGKKSKPKIKVFKAQYRGLIVLKGITFFSLCEHHMLPFFGTMDVGYVPRKNICGLSKIVRVVEFFAKRPQLQERFTQQVAEFLYSELDALGVGVVCKARHMCMEMRGVQNSGVETVTSVMLGVFFSSSDCRNEFLQLIK